MELSAHEELKLAYNKLVKEHNKLRVEHDQLKKENEFLKSIRHYRFSSPSSEDYNSQRNCSSTSDISGISEDYCSFDNH